MEPNDSYETPGAEGQTGDLSSQPQVGGDDGEPGVSLVPMEAGTAGPVEGPGPEAEGIYPPTSEALDTLEGHDGAISETLKNGKD